MPPVNDSEPASQPIMNGNTDESRKFTFPSHHFHMVQLAQMCQENKEYTDCVIRVGSEVEGHEELRAHRLVLGSVSPFLKLVFADLPQNHSEATILVPGVQKRVVKALLDFFYTGQMTVERQDTSDLQLLIDTLQIDPGLITVDTVQTPAANVTNPVSTNASAPEPETNSTDTKPDKTASSEQPAKEETEVCTTKNEDVNESAAAGENNDFFGRLIDRKRKTTTGEDFEIPSPKKVNFESANTTNVNTDKKSSK